MLIKIPNFILTAVPAKINIKQAKTSCFLQNLQVVNKSGGFYAKIHFLQKQKKRRKNPAAKLFSVLFYSGNSSPRTS